MNIELKDCWWLLLIMFVCVYLLGLGVGQSKDDYRDYYSLGYAECKGSMEHKYYKKAIP